MGKNGLSTIVINAELVYGNQCIRLKKDALFSRVSFYFTAAKETSDTLVFWCVKLTWMSDLNITNIPLCDPRKISPKTHA